MKHTRLLSAVLAAGIVTGGATLITGCREKGPAERAGEKVDRTMDKIEDKLDPKGYWLAPLGYNSHPFKVDGSKAPQPGDYSQTYVGDETDTSPYPDPKLMGISIEAYVRNMGILIRALDASK